jgi:hypothetical protein
LLGQRFTKQFRINGDMFFRNPGARHPHVAGRGVGDVIRHLDRQ